MSKVRFELDENGLRSLLKSTEMQSICLEYATRTQQTAEASASGYVVEPRNYPERSGYAVRANTYKARKDNLDNNTLLKALGGGR